MATAPASGTATGPSARTEYDEFGGVLTSTPNVTSWAKRVAGYGWLGGHQRTTEFAQTSDSGPPMELGARVYLPTVGRFLQVDPIEGASANAYDYSNQDPVNKVDLDGRSPIDNGCPTYTHGTCKWTDAWIIATLRKRVRLHKLQWWGKAAAGCISAVLTGAAAQRTENTIMRRLINAKSERKVMKWMTKIGSIGRFSPLGKGISCAFGVVVSQ